MLLSVVTQLSLCCSCFFFFFEDLSGDLKNSNLFPDKELKGLFLLPCQSWQSISVRPVGSWCCPGRRCAVPIWCRHCWNHRITWLNVLLKTSTRDTARQVYVIWTSEVTDNCNLIKRISDSKRIKIKSIIINKTNI